MTVSIIVAMTDDGVIGKDNTLPWHLPEDLARFKKLTMGHTILMGRKTYDSIGRALPGRQNIVLTRDLMFRKEGVTVVHDLRAALLESTKNNASVFIIGGAEVFREALQWPELERIYFTLIHEKIAGDTLFPEVDWQRRFAIEKQTDHVGEKADRLKYSFVDSVRIPS